MLEIAAASPKKSILNPTITYLTQSELESLPPKPIDFLRRLTGLTVIDINGNDPTRTRVITTLIHGNEPSGLIACHLWLQSKAVPATNVRILICNPEAANTKPFFTNRYVEHSDDLNRFFASTDIITRPVILRASQILALIRDVNPEAIIDLHNTSGKSPAFAVSVNDDLKHKLLVELFTNRLILTRLNVGAVMEQQFDAPIVTIECGGCNQNAAHQIASNGLFKFVNTDYLFLQKTSSVQILKNPIRLELINDTSVGFSNCRLPTTDITLRDDIELLNNQETKAGEFIGWFDDEYYDKISAVDVQGIEQVENLFSLEDGLLFTRKKMQLFMATTVPEIATKDCLFYTTTLAS